ncbi:hypothetical protein [Acinetobacter pollinis]|uniref:hypothetical protein n=1 Tax=Acinetobacter sp. ESL0695 TaxID=2983215 RepID=UPI002B1BCE89|nr:hypothetical protein [Acinetobacter pollinis]
MYKKQYMVLTLMGVMLALSACNNNNGQKVEIKPAPKLSKDATAYAKKSWELMNQVEPLVENRALAQIDNEVRRPLRELGSQWMINVKMGDSVAEGNFALCRKAMVSLDTWARAVQAKSNSENEDKLNYLHNKQLCKDALDHPALGNS